MRNLRLMACCWLLLLCLCLTGGAGQVTLRYPQNADDIITFVEVFSQTDFSVNDAIKHLGTVNTANHDDQIHLHDLGILLTPFPSHQDSIKRIVLNTFDDPPDAIRKLDSVEIDYIKPISISYGELKKKYGVPSRLPPPLIKCLPGVDCRPRFVGYRFTYMPDQESLATGKKLESSIALKMEWSKVIPKHTDKDLLVVKAIRFKRIWKD